MRVKLFILISALTIAFLILGFLNMKPNDFYHYNRKEDLWRFPLIEPYELLSPTNDSSDDWVLVIEDQNPFNTKNRYHIFNIDSIAVNKKQNIILLHSHKAQHPLGKIPLWVLIDVKKGEKKFFKTNLELKTYLNKYHINSYRFLSFKQILPDFINNLKLPF